VQIFCKSTRCKSPAHNLRMPTVTLTPDPYLVPRGPLHDTDELEQFEAIVQAAYRARLVRARCDFFPQRVGGDVLVWCFFNRGGPPGKRYRHVRGWLASFRQDLQDGFFLAA